MATLENFDPRTLALDFSGINQAINERQNLGIANRKLALAEQLQRANLDVNEREIALKELQNLNQQGIQDVLTQQLGGGQQDQVAPSGSPRVVPGELAITPGGAIGVQPSRLQPLTQSVADKQRDISLKLLGFGKAGREALSSISGIFDAENEQEALQAKQEVEDTQRFALKLDRAKTRQAKNKLIEDQQSQQLLDTGQIDQELLRMRNMSDDELQGEIISDLAIGENLKEFVDNRLTPPVEKPETRTSLAKNLELADIDPKSKEGQKIIRESLTKPGVKIDINKGLDFKIPLGFMLLDQNDPNKGVTPIPGGPKDNLVATNAAKVQMLATARKAAKGVRAFIFDKEGELNRTNIFNSQFNTPFTKGRELRNKFEFGIQAITRAETGAAMPPQEVENTRTRFMPQIGDTISIVNTKLEMFNDFLNGSLKLIDPSGRFNNERFQTELINRSEGEENGTPPPTTSPPKRRLSDMTDEELLKGF